VSSDSVRERVLRLAAAPGDIRGVMEHNLTDLAQAVIVIEAARDCVFDGRTPLGRKRYRIFRDALKTWDALP